MFGSCVTWNSGIPQTFRLPVIGAQFNLFAQIYLLISRMSKINITFFTEWTETRRQNLHDYDLDLAETRINFKSASSN